MFHNLCPYLPRAQGGVKSQKKLVWSDYTTSVEWQIESLGPSSLYGKMQNVI
uniref:Uncharacterized protein n=1 Tax=Arundo donax TaxID=35708 RepID=A0A0A8ZNW9_ARUDO